VLDATFRRCARRDRVAAIADDHGVDARFVRVDCDEDVAKTRIAERDGDASDATVAVYEQLKGEFEPIEREHVRVDNSGSLAASRTQVTRAFADRAVGR
jgi:predicted kinase